MAYRNFQENHDRLTNRAVRSLVKLFSIDENCIQDDLKELQSRIDRIAGQEEPGPSADHEEEVVLDVHEADQGLTDKSVAPYKQLYQVTFDDNSEESTLKAIEQGMTDQLPRSQVCCRKCCCLPHCLVENHTTNLWKKAMESSDPFLSALPVNIEESCSEQSSVNTDQVTAADTDIGITQLLFSVSNSFMDM